MVSKPVVVSLVETVVGTDVIMEAEVLSEAVVVSAGIVVAVEGTELQLSQRF